MAHGARDGQLCLFWSYIACLSPRKQQPLPICVQPRKSEEPSNCLSR